MVSNVIFSTEYVPFNTHSDAHEKATASIQSIFSINCIVAWYQVGGAAAKQTKLDGGFTASSNPYSLDAVVFEFEWGGTDWTAGEPGHYNNKIMSNRFGETFYYAGVTKNQDTTHTISEKVGVGTLTVKTSASAQQLQGAASAGAVVLDVKILASGQVKVDGTTTTVAGTDTNHNETKDDGDSYALGVLGVELANEPTIGYVRINQDGTVDYSTDNSSYSTFTASTGHGFTFYYGVEAASTSAETDNAVAAYTLGMNARLYAHGGSILDEYVPAP